MGFSEWCARRWHGFRTLMKRPTTYPMTLLAVIALFLNADQNLIAPNLTQIAREFNFTDEERDTKVGGQLTLGFSLVGGFAAMFVGYYADKVNRRNLFTLVVLIGEFSCFCTLFVTSYDGLFVTRAITGVSIGGANPLIMSMIGDMFDDKERGKAISFIQIMLSLGVALGQSVAGFVGPADALGWRAPFVIIACPTFILAPIYLLTTKDPVRGGKELAVRQAAADAGAEVEVYQEKMDCSKLALLLKNKTAIIAFLQGIPGSLPWGVMLVFFQDFLVQNIGPQVEGGISVQQSTLVVLTFGFGAGLGILAGGFIADRLWKRDPRKVAVVMSVTTALGALPIYGLINGPPANLLVYAIVTLPSGFLASITGTAIRTVLMNVTLPETRGTAFAFHTLFDDIGRGLGPLWVGLLIASAGGRIPAFNLALIGWFGCSVLLIMMVFTIMPDLRRQQEATAAAMERSRNAPLSKQLIIAAEDLESAGTASPLYEASPPQKKVSEGSLGEESAQVIPVETPVEAAPSIPEENPVEAVPTEQSAQVSPERDGTKD